MQIFTKFITAIFIFAALTIANADTSESTNLLPEISDYIDFFNNQYAKAVDGDANAQLYIGVLYEHGLGIGKDLTLSHVYYNLASASGVQETTSQRKIIEKMLSKDEFANARKLAKLYKPGECIDHPRQIDSIELMSKNTQKEPESNDVNLDETASLSDSSDKLSSTNSTDSLHIFLRCDYR